MKKSNKKIIEDAVEAPANELPMVMEAEVAYGTKSISGGVTNPDMPSISSFLGETRTTQANSQNFSNKYHFISLIRDGVTMEVLQNLVAKTTLTSIEIANILHTSERTLRRYTTETVLNPEQTERVLEIARLYARGSEVFGSLKRFITWMDSDIIALGNVKPKSLLDTSIGIEILQEELGRIEHGIFA